MKVGDLVKWHASRYYNCGIIISIDDQWLGVEIKCYTVLWADGSLNHRLKRWQLFPYEGENEQG